MGMDIIILDENKYEIDFSMIKNEFNHTVKDFTNNGGMKWYYHDTCPDFHCKELHGCDNIVESGALITGSKKIIIDITKKLGIDLGRNDDPVSIRDYLLFALTKKMDKGLNENEFEWYRYLSDRIENLSLMKYAELAVFFYSIGTLDYSILWSC